MKMALSSMGVFSGEITGNEDGAYAILPNTDDYSARLIYYDYATRQLIWLSNQMIVTNDEENPGWIEDTFGGAVPMAANDCLYVVKYGKSPIPSIQYEGSPSYLLRMETNAANRQKLVVPQGKLLKSSTGIAADGEELYLILTDYDAEAMQMTGMTLCKTDFEGNQWESMLSLGADKDAAIVGVYSDGLVLQRAWMPIEYEDARIEDQLPHLSYALQLYSITEGKLIDTNFTWAQGDLTFAMGDGVLYYVRSGETRLYVHDLLTGEEEVLTDDLTPASADASVYLIGEPRDNHLLFNVSTKDFSSNYSVSLSTYEVQPCALSFEHEDGQLPVQIIAECEQYFLVNNGFITLHLSATGTDGSFYTYDSPITRYALMKKDDYWNSVPNYIPFDDSLFQSLSLSK